MIQISLDTSFLISFADPGRPNHSVAVDYFRHCLAQRIPMWISVIAAGEFEVGQPVKDLPLQNFRIQPYNLLQAIRSASLYKTLRENSKDYSEDRRPVIINDLKIIAQAEEDQIPIILTEDANTLSRIVESLRKRNAVAVRVLLLKDGFTPARLNKPDQDELRLSAKTTRDIP